MWAVSTRLYEVTEQGNQGDLLRTSDTHPGANTVRPSKTLGTKYCPPARQPAVLLLMGPVLPCPALSVSSPTQEVTHPTVEGGAAPEVSSISRGSFL